MTHRMPMAVLLTATLPWIGGCQAPRKFSTGVPTVNVQTTPSQMTAAQRRIAFARAYSRGQSLADSGQFAEALSAFQAALDAEPESVPALLNVGACLETLGDPTEALRLYRKAVQLDPKEAVAYTNLGTAYIKLYHRERNRAWRDLARNAWRQSLALEPGQADVERYLALAEDARP